MLFWARFPFIRITMLFAFGIWTGDCLSLPLPSHWIFWTCSVLLFFLVSRRFIREKFRRFNLTISFLTFSVIFLTGNLLMQLQKIRKEKIENTLLKVQVEHYLVQVILMAGKTDRYQKTIADINLVQSDGQPIKLHGKILLYVPAGDPVRYGDQLLIKGKPNSFNEPIFPHEFNYKKHMWRRGILFQQFLTGEDYIRFGRESTPSLRQMAYLFRENLIDKIQQRISDTRVQGLMIALTTGRRDYFDQETYDQFLGAGIVHVLAVSGLHIGILYFILIQLTRPLSFNLTSRMIRMALLLSFFLFFAFVTGLSPSVLRSVVMFSIMLLGTTFNRRSPVLNSVFLSAFLLLCYDPGLLWQVGFQLSYSAVLGILFFQPVFQSMWNPQIKPIRWLWNLAVVSLSAQLTTLPFTLFYFKQFPTYFILSNLFAIPFVTFFIPGSIVFIGTYFLISLNQIIALLLDHTGRLFLKWIGIIHGLPGSLLSPINIGTFEALLILFIIFLLFIFLRYRKHRLSGYLLILLGILITEDALRYIHTSGEKKILVYSIAGSPVMELIDGHRSFIILDSTDPDLSKKVQYHTGNFHIHHDIRSRMIPMKDLRQHIPSLIKDGTVLICWNGRSLLIRNSTDILNQNPKIQIVPDYWFVKKKHLYQLRIPDNPTQPKEISVADPIISIFRKKKKPEIEFRPEWTSITL